MNILNIALAIPIGGYGIGIGAVLIAMAYALYKTFKGTEWYDDYTKVWYL